MIPNLTLSMIVKNEEKNLRDCLESVKDVVDEIVIVDTGSEDNTINIAREFGAKIFHFKWIDDFSAARNFALSRSKGNWILYLDADERLTPDSIPELNKIVSTKNKEAVFCLVKSISQNVHKPNIMRYARLFRNGKKIEFRGSIHEQIIYSLEEQNYNKVVSEIEIIHIGYDIDDAGIKQKAERNLNNLLKDLQKDYSVYNVFQISQTYGALDDKENATKYYKKVLEFNGPDCRPFYKAHAYRYLATCELVDQNFEQAHYLAVEGLKHDPTLPLLNFVTAKVNVGVGNFPAATDYCKKALKYNVQDSSKDFEIYTQDDEIIFLGLKASTLSHDLSSFNFFFEKLKMVEGAKTKTNSLLESVHSLFNHIPLNEFQTNSFEQNIDKENLELFVSLLEKYNNKEIALNLFDKLYQKFGNEVQLLNSYGTVLNETGNYEKAIELFEKSININMSNPAIIFFLISCYLQTDNLEAIPDIIERAENRFKNIPQVMEKMNQLKNHLLALK